MKKLLPVLVFGLLIPQLALAAWWNPFSWKVFRKSDNKTQQLEDRVKELEKKLQDADANTASTSKNVQTNPAKVNTQTQKTQQSATEKNYAPLASLSFNSTAQLIKLRIDALNLISDDADRYIDGIPPLVSKARTGANLFPDSADLYNEIADIYTQHRNNIYGFQKSVDEYTSQLQKYVSELESVSLSAQSQFISKADAEKLDLANKAELKKVEDSVKTIRTTYDNYTDAFLEDKEAILTALEISMSNLQSSISEINAMKSSIPVYRPAPIINKPLFNITTTNCNVLGNTISCNSSSY